MNISSYMKRIPEFSDSNFKNASVEFDSESLKPTYKLIIGIPGLSNAVSISANLGLPEDLVWEAKQLLITQRDPSALAVERLQDTQQRLDVNLKEAEALNAEAEELKQHYEKELSQHKKDKKRTLKGIKERFETQLDNAKDEIKEILNEGGAPVFTTYAVEIGDSLWNSLYDYLVSAYPEEECDFCSIYRIEGVYEEEGQKFAILQNRSTTAYYRMNFSLTEEGVTFDSVLTEVEKEFIPTEAQFDSAAVEAYELEYAKKDEKKEDGN